MAYKMRKEDVQAFGDFMGIQTRMKGKEAVFELCPYCGGGNHSDTETFSVNVETGAFCCLRAKCGKSGHFVELCRDFDYKLEFETPKIYKVLKQPKKRIESKDGAVAYLASRGIGEEVCRRYEITTHKNNENVLVFPFYDGEGKLQFIKYRNIAWKKGMVGSKEWAEKDTMPILFGMKQCNRNNPRLVITEGQIDSLSLAQAGIENAVSVPTGAKGFTWLVPVYDWICQFKEIVVFGDYENGIVTLYDELKARLPMTVKVVRHKDYLGEKDANDILRKYGTNALVTAVEKAEVPKLENVKDLATVKSIDINRLEKIKTQIPEIDRVIGGLCMGQVILLTGKSGDGKSTFGSQLICAALDQHENVFAYSGELPDFHFKRWIDFQLAGNENVVGMENEFGEFEYNIKDKALKQITDWYRGRCYLYDNDFIPEDKDELTSLVSTIEQAIKQYNTRLIFIDNLMTAMEVVEDARNLYISQSRFVGQLKHIAAKYNVVVILVAHPRKTKEEFDNTDVSGTGDIINKVDVVINYQRDDENTATDSLVMITKNRINGKRLVGKKQAIRLMFSTKTKRIFSANEKSPKHYGWEQPEQIKSDELPF